MFPFYTLFKIAIEQYTINLATDDGRRTTGGNSYIVDRPYFIILSKKLEIKKDYFAVYCM